MNIALSPPSIIPMTWSNYVAKHFDTDTIPWPRYRYSGTGVVEVAIEANTNNLIASELLILLRGEMKRLGNSGKVYTAGGVGIEVIHSQKEERIPDLCVVSAEGKAALGREGRTITLDMPDPILVAEIMSPSTGRDDVEVKAMEYVNRNVMDYLAIDWRNEIIYGWSRHLNSYRLTEYKRGKRLSLISFPKLTITTDELFDV